MGRAQPPRLGPGPDRGEIERAQSAQFVPPVGAVHGSGELGRTDELGAPTLDPRRRVTIRADCAFPGAMAAPYLGAATSRSAFPENRPDGQSRDLQHDVVPLLRARPRLAGAQRG